MDKFELKVFDADSSFSIRHMLAFELSENDPEESMSLFNQALLESLWVLSRVSYISLAETHFEILSSSLESRADTMMFIATQSRCSLSEETFLDIGMR